MKKRKKNQLLTAILILILSLSATTVSYFIFKQIQQPYINNYKLVTAPSPTPFYPILEHASYKTDYNYLFSFIPDKSLSELNIDLSAKVLYESADNLMYGSLDQKQAITLLQNISKRRLKLAGFFENKNTFYYTVSEGDKTKVYKSYLSQNTPQKIFEFTAIDKSKDVYSSSVQVSPNEQYLAYSIDDGAYLYSISTNTIKKLISNERICQGYAHCASYYKPNWSVDSQIISFTKGLFEGSQNFIIDPFTGYTKVFSGGHIVWSRNGHQFVIYGSGYTGSNTIRLVSDLTNEVDILAKFTKMKYGYSDSADWTEAGQVVYIFGGESAGIGVFNTKDYSNKIIKLGGSNPGDLKLKWIDQVKVILLNTEQESYIISLDPLGKFKLPSKIDFL